MDRRAFLRAMLIGGPLVMLGHSVAGQGREMDTPVARQQALVSRAGHVRVLIGGSQQRGTITAIAPLTVNGVGQISPGETLEFRAGSGGVSVSNGGRTIATGTRVAIEPVSLQSASNGAFTYLGTKYRGEVHLLVRGGSVDVINDVFIDDWLKGLIGAEIGDDAPMEALKAQAVAARSEACYKLLRPPHAQAGYDFCSGVHCQAYKGMSRENERTVAACDATAGLILAASGDIVDAVYSNVCGGMSAMPEDVWDSPPGRPGYAVVRDGLNSRALNLSNDAAAARFIRNPGELFCDSAQPGYPKYAQKYYRWQVTRDIGQLQRAFGVGTIRDIAVTERRPSGRVRQLTAQGATGTRTLTKELPIRRALDLWSGFFVVEPIRSGGVITGAVFTGAGNGHGVGMCQQGARIMAARGMGFVEILRHYFPGASIERLYRVS
jgi:SpoIID/LytB domain protein